MNLIYRLLLKNTSPARIVGFILSNFIGLAIIMGGIVFYGDAGSLWSSEDSFMRKDYLIVNKKVSSAGMWGQQDLTFTQEELDSLRSQPWVNKIGEFRSNNFKVWASVGNPGSKSISTMLFFESVPDDFIDGVESEDWTYEDSKGIVPVIISKDYLTLYNFGFAGSQGLPKLSENLIGSIPLHLTLTSEDGRLQEEKEARIVGYSNRINSILAPDSFIKEKNEKLARNTTQTSKPSRLIIAVNSPGDVAITDYIESHDLEVAGDKSASSASYLLKVLTGIILSVGALITIMSLFILLLSVSLLMEKNRDKLHNLLLLGYPLAKVAAPYLLIIVLSTAIAYGGAVICTFLLRIDYLAALKGLGADPGSPWVGYMTGGILSLIIIILNVLSVFRRVKSSWMLQRKR